MVYVKLPPKIEKIFIDLDDTLVDFVGPASELSGHRGPMTKEVRNRFWGLVDNKEAQDKLWAQINKIGPEWWANLPKLPWADELWAVANEASPNVAIMTSPGSGKNHPGAELAAHGKILWTMKNFNENMLVLTYKKHLCASPGAVLIDDWGKFIKPWAEHGGCALQLKRSWKASGFTAIEIIDALKKYARFNRH